MEWTKDKPTEPGLYLWSNGKKGQGVHLHWVWERNGEMLLGGMPMGGIGGWWFGPVPKLPPQEQRSE